MTQKILSDEMGRDALEVRNTEILRRWPEINWLQLAMDACEMKNCLLYTSDAADE